MIVDLNDLIYFENDAMPDEGGFIMTDFNGRHKPHPTVTGDFHIGSMLNNPETLILFAAYPANPSLL